MNQGMKFHTWKSDGPGVGILWMNFRVWKMMDQVWHVCEWSFLCKNLTILLDFWEWIYSQLSHFPRSSSFLVSCIPLDQILTTPGHLCNFYTTPRIDVSIWWRSHELIGGGCEVKVRNWGQITDYYVYENVTYGSSQKGLPFSDQYVLHWPRSIITELSLQVLDRFQK